MTQKTLKKYYRKNYCLAFLTQGEKDYFEDMLRNIKYKTGQNHSVSTIKAMEDYWEKVK